MYYALPVEAVARALPLADLDDVLEKCQWPGCAVITLAAAAVGELWVTCMDTTS